MKNKQALTLVAMSCLPGLALAHVSSDGAAHFHEGSAALNGIGAFAGLLLVMALFAGLAWALRGHLKRARAARAADQGRP